MRIDDTNYRKSLPHFRTIDCPDFLQPGSHYSKKYAKKPYNPTEAAPVLGAASVPVSIATERVTRHSRTVFR